MQELEIHDETLNFNPNEIYIVTYFSKFLVSVPTYIKNKIITKREESKKVREEKKVEIKQKKEKTTNNIRKKTLNFKENTISKMKSTYATYLTVSENYKERMKKNSSKVQTLVKTSKPEPEYKKTETKEQTTPVEIEKKVNIEPIEIKPDSTQKDSKEISNLKSIAKKINDLQNTIVEEISKNEEMNIELICKYRISLNENIIHYNNFLDQTLPLEKNKEEIIEETVEDFTPENKEEKVPFTNSQNQDNNEYESQKENSFKNRLNIMPNYQTMLSPVSIANIASNKSKIAQASFEALRKIKENIKKQLEAFYQDVISVKEENNNTFMEYQEQTNPIYSTNNQNEEEFKISM